MVRGTERGEESIVPELVLVKPCILGRGALSHFRQHIALVVPLTGNTAAVVYPVGHIAGLKSCTGLFG